MTLLSAFAFFALVLASLGIYGVISYSVGQRVREIGIRMALGASAGQVQRRVLYETLVLSGLGILLGTLGAAVLAGTMRSLLFGVQAADPVSFVSMVLVTAMIAVLAGFLPAVRAARVDPLTALRQD